MSSMMPPLPAKKSCETGDIRPAPSVSTTPTDSYLSFKSSHSGDEQAVHEAMLDPSSWVLKNWRTGQEVKATTFMEALLNERVRWPTSSPQMGSSGTKGWSRRHRNKTLPIQRPTLIPQSNDFVSFAPGGATCMGPPSPPPPLQLTFPGMSSRSPQQARGRSSLPEGTFSRARSVSTSDSTSSAVLCAGEGAREFKLTNLSTTQIVPSLHVGGIRAIAFSPSGALLATCGVDRRCCVFRVQQHRETAAGSEGRSPSKTALSEGLARRRDSVSMGGRLIDDKPMRVLTGHADSVVALAWTGDDKGLLTASADGTVRCWNPLEGDQCSEVYEHGGAVTSLAWEPACHQTGREAAGRGKFLTGCLDAKVRLFCLGSSEPEQVVLESRPVTAVAFCSSGKSFAVGCVSGTVVFYRTEGMVPQLTVECRRHGFRHSAAQRTRLATSPVRRLSAGNDHATANGIGNGKVNGDADGRGRVRRRRNTMGPKAGPRAPAPVEERVTGLCFRPQAKGPFGDSPASDGEGKPLLGSTCTEKAGDSSEERAPKSSVGVGGDEVSAEQQQQQQQQQQGHDVANGKPKGDEAGDEAGDSLEHVADLLVSTNDNRSRILVSGAGGEVTVGFKLKGHSTEGVLGRHTAARYSEDGEFVISGSTDGYVHVFRRPTTLGSTTPRRAVTWSGHGGQDGHERAQVSDKTVGVALFAPASVVRSLGAASSRVILTGDDEGCFKVFCERNVEFVG